MGWLSLCSNVILGSGAIRGDMLMDDLRGLSVAVMRSAIRHRSTGHAAEMSFFAMLALVPATVTVGATMHVVARVAGEQTALREQAAAVSSIRVIIGPGLGEEVIVPFVRAQLAQQHGGVAVGGVLITWWLFSHLFHSTSHALDTVYEVRGRRRTPVRRAIALAHALSSVVAITVTLAVMSAVPLGFSTEPDTSVVSRGLQIAWTAARWPLLVFVVLLTFTLLYRYSPEVRHSFQECLPGAVLAVGLWTLLILLFRYFLALGFGAPTGVMSVDPEIILIGRAVGAVVATALLFYYASSAVLLGAELNAELIRRRGGRIAFPEPDDLPNPRSWPRALPSAATWPSPRFFTRRAANGRPARVPAPSPGRRVRVVPTTATGADASLVGPEKTGEGGRLAL
jgi:membrane protein